MSRSSEVMEQLQLFMTAVLQGKKLHDAGKISEAEQVYLRVLADASDESFLAMCRAEGMRGESLLSTTHMLLAECLLSAKDLSAALKHGRSAVSSAPEKADICITLGDLMSSEHPVEACAFFEEALRADCRPETRVKALVGGGNALCLMNLFPEVRRKIEDIEQVLATGLRLTPEVAMSVLNLKEVYAFKARDKSGGAGAASEDETQLTVKQLNLRGMQARREHRFEQSEAILRKALEKLALERNQSTELQVAVLVNLSQTLQCQAAMLGGTEQAGNKWLEAIKLAKAAAAIKQEDGSVSYSIALALMGFASVVAPGERTIQLEAAAAFLQEAIIGFELWQNKLGDDMEARIRTFEGQQEAYMQLVRCLDRLDRPWEALVVAERARTRVLMFQLIRSHQGKAQLPAELQYGQFDRDASCAWEVIESARRACGHDTVLVEYAHTENELFIWVLTEDRAFFRHVSTQARQLGDSLYEDGIAFLTRKYTKERGLKGGAILEQLNDHLIQPIAGILDQMKPSQRLVIIAPEFLGFVPFAALRDTAYPGQEYLIQRHTLAVAPSARALLQSALFQAEKIPSGCPSPALIVGNPNPMALGEPQLKHAQAEAERIGELLRNGGFECRVLVGSSARIDLVKEELEAASVVLLATHGLVSRTYPQGAILLAEPDKPAIPSGSPDEEERDRLAGWSEEDAIDWTDESWLGYKPSVNLRSEASLVEVRASLKGPDGRSVDSQPDIARWGVEEDNSASSANLFKDEERLGVLSGQQLAQLRLPAQIVVLSACRTGLGEVTSEGVLGLGRALLLGGVPTAVLSLWAVPDKSTEVFMESVFKALLAGQDIDQAMRSSMLDMIAKGWLPHSWAPFFCFGLPTTKLPRPTASSSSRLRSVVHWMGVLAGGVAASVVALKVVKVWKA